MLRNLKFNAVMQLTETENIAVALFIEVAGDHATAPLGGGQHTLVRLGTRQRRRRARMGAALRPYGNGDKPTAKTRLAKITGLSVKPFI